MGGGNRKGAAISCLRHLCFGEEKKMRFSRVEVVSHRTKIRSKYTNVVVVMRKKLRELLRHLVPKYAAGKFDYSMYVISVS